MRKDKVVKITRTIKVSFSFVPITVYPRRCHFLWPYKLFRSSRLNFDGFLVNIPDVYSDRKFYHSDIRMPDLSMNKVSQSSILYLNIKVINYCRIGNAQDYTSQTHRKEKKGNELNSEQFWNPNFYNVHRTTTKRRTLHVTKKIHDMLPTIDSQKSATLKFTYVCVYIESSRTGLTPNAAHSERVGRSRNGPVMNSNEQPG